MIFNTPSSLILFLLLNSLDTVIYSKWRPRKKVDERRGMAKKGQHVQLQVEVNTDEEWNKLLKREGLIVIDVYSEWCGPCTAMQANLKKMKLEVGGDFLHLAVAKADSVSSLKRFANRSEPTWMFIAKGQMVALLFGANAPVLQRNIIEQINIEKECLAGKRDRIKRKPEELSEEEVAKQTELDALEDERERIVKEKMFEQLKKKRTDQANHILETLRHVGFVMVLPHAMRKGPDVLEALWKERGLVVSKKDRVAVQEAWLEELEFFSSYKMNELTKTHVTSGDKSMVFQIVHSESTEAQIDAEILTLVYGERKSPPGSPESAAWTLLKRAQVLDEEEEEGESPKDLSGVWAPENELVKAVALKFFFPHMVNPLLPPEVEVEPPHIAVCYDAFKRCDVVKLMQKYPDQVLSLGFFTSDHYLDAKLIVNTVEKFEKRLAETTYNEKLVLKLSRKHSELVLPFAELGPTHMSINVIEGEKECAIFFPEGYNDIKDEDEQTKVLKKKKSKTRTTSKLSDSTVDTGEIIFEEGLIGDGADTIENLQELEGPVEDSHFGSELSPVPEGPVDEDKATSPMEKFGTPDGQASARSEASSKE